jgi:hypothetical protein
MIYEIFVIKNGGPCLLRKSVSDSEKIKIDEDLFSSFTSAICSFASELKEIVQTVELREFKLVFFSLDGLLLIAVSDKLEDKLSIQRKLALLANEFRKNFGQHFNTWSGNLTDFNGFDEKIASLLLNSQGSDTHFI